MKLQQELEGNKVQCNGCQVFLKSLHYLLLQCNLYLL